MNDVGCGNCRARYASWHDWDKVYHKVACKRIITNDKWQQNKQILFCGAGVVPNFWCPLKHLHLLYWNKTLEINN